MGVYLNPGNRPYKELLNSPIVVDKSLLIKKTNKIMGTVGKNICISRPRRFGKSTDANMLVAYYSRGCDSSELFSGLKIAQCDGYAENLNKHNVIHLDMQKFLSASKSMDDMISLIDEEAVYELEESFGIKSARKSMPLLLGKICANLDEGFIFIIDEWDCIFREYRRDKESQNKYLDYLRLLLKEQPYVELVYMTGILPIKKYGTHSALNMFDEISMIDSKDYSEFMGFTEAEVQNLCEKYDVDYGKMKEWYDGYHMRGGISTYSPRSVTASINNHDFVNYWSQTETYEALRAYIDLNYDGLKETIIDLLAGRTARVDTLSFQNDMSTFASKDDILTLLIHLGYLGYLIESGEVYIPNNEVKDTFIVSVKNSNWDYITQVFKDANDLLDATWTMQGERVASYIEHSHYETSILNYNDENALAYTVSLAYITAKNYYTIVRELPAGKGFADMVFIPKPDKADKPAMVIELKYDQSAESGIEQIKEKKYYLGLEHYLDNLLLVAINYDKDTKKHECVIKPFGEARG